MNAWTWLANLSLRKKLVLLLATVGIGPLIVTFALSYGELRDLILNRENYTANQTFEQSLAMLSAKIAHIEEVSSMIMVDEQINGVFSGDPDKMQVWDQLSRFQKISDYTQILQSNSDFDGIVYYIDDRFVVTGDRALMYRPFRKAQEEAWAQKILQGGGEPTWVVVDETESGGARRRYLTLGRVLWNVNDYAEPVGLATFRVDASSLPRLLTTSAVDQSVYLETSDGSLAASSDADKLERMRLSPEAAAKASPAGFEKAETPSGTYLARSARIGSSNLYLRSVLSQKAASHAISDIRTQMLTSYLIIGALLLLVIYPVTRSFTSRIFLLMNKMTQVRQGRLNTLDVAPREDEVGHLVSSYNYMINSVQELLGEQFRLGQEKQSAELRALQSQINPHFLYNTLDMIVWMAQKGERDNIQQVVYSLSDYYRLILNKGEDQATVEEELRLCSLYIEIQQIRFKNRISFGIDVEESIRSCLLPKITLQPLVENAIVHGILEKPEGSGSIRIRGRAEADRLVLAVEDDGPGWRRGGTRRPDYRGSGYGIRNIEKRLELMFGQANVIRGGKDEGFGACVRIEAPIVRRE